MSGTAKFGDVEVSIQSVAAIDIVEDPCDTYKHNFPARGGQRGEGGGKGGGDVSTPFHHRHILTLNI